MVKTEIHSVFLHKEKNIKISTKASGSNRTQNQKKKKKKNNNNNNDNKKKMKASTQYFNKKHSIQSDNVFSILKR